jgi:hypothetical protein
MIADESYVYSCCFVFSWYHESLNRVEAEDMLKRIHCDGAFLVRHSGQDQYFAISFR